MKYRSKFNVLTGLGLSTAAGLAFVPAPVPGTPVTGAVLSASLVLALAWGYAAALRAGGQSVQRQAPARWDGEQLAKGCGWPFTVARRLSGSCPPYSAKVSAHSECRVGASVIGVRFFSVKYLTPSAPSA